MAHGRRTSPAQTIVPIAGDRTSARLLNKLANYGVYLILRATVQVSVAPATALRNRGSVCAMFDEIGISENGTDVVLFDGGTARFITELLAPSALSSVRAAAAIATYNLVEMVRIPFTGLFNAGPGETAFMEKDTRQALEVFVKLNSAAAATLFNAGPATITISAVSVTVVQEGETEPAPDSLPLFRPRIRQLVEGVSGTNAQLPTYLKTVNPVRAIIVKQECATSGEAQDILNRFTLRGDGADIIGPRTLPLPDAQLMAEAELGGDVYTAGSAVDGAYVAYNAAKFGRLSDLLNPARYSNLRLESDVQVSATGTGSSRLRITLIEMERDTTPGPDGRKVVADELPFTL